MKQIQSVHFLNVLPMIALLFAVVLSGCEKDVDPGVRPTVTSTDPASDATDVSVDHKMSASFSVPMDASTATKFSLKQGNVSITGVSEYSGTTVSFMPVSRLLPNTLYTATISKTSINQGGTSMLNDHTWSFTTGALPDTQLPIVSTTDPLDNTPGVARNKTVSVTFSEAMDPLTITSSTFTLKQGTTEVAGTIAYAVNTATFTPSVVLSSGLVYSAMVSTGAKDLAGNAVATNMSWEFTTTDNTSTLAAVDLGAAGDYVILAKAAINNIPGSAITGDLGLSPAAASYITGFALTDATGYATSTQVTGKIYAATMASPTPDNLTTAVENMITAYNNAAGRLSPDFVELATGNIGGLTLSSGLYKWTTSVSLPSDIVISGGADEVWIFQIAGDLSMSSAVDITLTGGAQAKNIFWQVAGQATLGTTAHFEGVLLSKTGITLQTGASFNGRALAQTAVILDGNAVTEPQ